MISYVLLVHITHHNESNELIHRNRQTDKAKTLRNPTIEVEKIV